jgi:hypothetical protein
VREAGCPEQMGACCQTVGTKSWSWGAVWRQVPENTACTRLQSLMPSTVWAELTSIASLCQVLMTLATVLGGVLTADAGSLERKCSSAFWAVDVQLHSSESSEHVCSLL